MSVESTDGRLRQAQQEVLELRARVRELEREAEALEQHLGIEQGRAAEWRARVRDLEAPSHTWRDDADRDKKRLEARVRELEAERSSLREALIAAFVLNVGLSRDAAERAVDRIARAEILWAGGGT